MKLRITLNTEEVRAALVEYVNVQHSQVTFQDPAAVEYALYTDGTAAIWGKENDDDER